MAAGFHLSQHAVVRSREMGVGLAEIEQVLAHPEHTYPQHPRYGADAHMYQGGRLGVAVVGQPGSGVVKTVVWRYAEDGYVRPEAAS